MNHSLYFPANDQRHDKGHSGNGTGSPPEMSPAGCFCLRTPGRALSPTPGESLRHPPSPTSFLDRGWAGILTFQNHNTLTTLSRENQVLVDDTDPADPESDSRVWYLPTGSTQPTLVWSGDFSLYITEADQIAFISWARSLDSSVLYSYDPVTGTLSSRDLGECIQIDGLFTLVRDGSLRYYYSQFKDGERTSWVYDTAADTTTPLTRFDGNLYVSWLSPDGQYWAEQDPSTDDPRLRVSRWEY